MRKFYSFLVLAVIALFSTLSVSAQDATFTGEATAAYRLGYTTTPITFSLSAVAEKLGTDATTLGTLLEKQFPDDPEDAEDAGIVWSVVQPDESVVSTFNCDPYGFWLDKDGVVTGWNTSQTLWDVLIGYDVANDVFSLNCGRVTGTDCDPLFAVGFTGTSVQTFELNGNKVSFKLTFTVEPKPEALPIEHNLSKLNIVNTINFECEQEPRGNYNSDQYSVYAPTLLADIGLESVDDLDLFNALNIRDYVFDNVSEMYSWGDSIHNKFSADPNPGFWFGPTFTYADNGDEIEDRENLAFHEYANAPIFYAADFRFARTEGNDSIYFILGQYPDAAGENGGSFRGTLYIVNGNKAVQLNIHLTTTVVDHSADPNLGIYQSAGQIAVDVNKPLTGSHTNYTNVINIDEVLAMLGAENGQDLSLWVRGTVDGDVLNHRNLGSDPGVETQWIDDDATMWINSDGVQTPWGTSACLMVSYYQLPSGEYAIGTMEMPGGQLTSEHPTQLTVYLCNPATQKYVEVVITWTVTTDDTDYASYTKKGTVAVTIQALIPEAADAYPCTDVLDNVIPLDRVTELLGTDNFELYGEKLVKADLEADPDATDQVEWTNIYTCTPHPGFWMDETGKYAVTFGQWGDGGASYGMTFSYSTGVVTIYSHPSFRRNNTNYSSTFYLVDNATQSYVEVPLTIKFVDSLSPVDQKGESTVLLALDPDNYVEDITLVQVDFDNIVEPMFDGDLNKIGAADWLIEVNGEFQKVSLFDPVATYFDADGKFLGTDEEDPTLADTAAFGFGFDYMENAFGLSALSHIDGEGLPVWAGNKDRIHLRVAMQYEDRLWVFNVYVGTIEGLDGIQGVSLDQPKNEAIYDLAGRRVTAPVKGIYIVGGKKVVK